MKIRLSTRDHRSLHYAVLIPSRGRPEQLMKTLEKQSFLDRASTYVRIHQNEYKDYHSVMKRFDRITWCISTSKINNGCVAREELRQTAVSVGYKRYVPTDDNARYTQDSLENLVHSSFVYPTQPCIVSGFHGTAPHFDSAKIRTAKEYGGYHFYEKWGAIFWSIPHMVYSNMEYPVDGGRMDDRFVSFAALRHGVSNWVVCMEAPYTKPTHQKGGYSASGRSAMMGQSIAALARDYPEYMEKISISFPWKKIIEKARSK